MKSIVCDFCGKEIEEEHQKGKLIWENEGSEEHLKEQDICFDCYNYKLKKKE